MARKLQCGVGIAVIDNRSGTPASTMSEALHQDGEQTRDFQGSHQLED
jgi:hypothetical protein